MMNENTTITTTTEETVATTNNAMVYMDKYGLLHSTREEAIAANED